MSKSEEGGAIYPEGVVSLREKLDYLKAVYGIDKPTLFDAVIKELIVDTFKSGNHENFDALCEQRENRTPEQYYNETFKSE